MNEIVNNFLLAGGKFMPEMHLRQPGFTYSACGQFTKNKKKRIQKFMQTGNTKFIYKNELDKAMVYKFFGKKSTTLNKSSGSSIVNERNYLLGNELHKPIIGKLKKRRVYSSFRDNISDVD